MNRTVCSRLVLGLAVLSSSAFLAGCAEEAPKPADATPATPAPAPATPGAPADAAKPDMAKPAETPAPAPGK